MKKLNREIQYYLMQFNFFIKSFIRVKVQYDMLGLRKYLAIRICFIKCYEINFRLPKWY